ncbi:hypothetical protein DIPPA_22863 [Diplonema papillatum]|nr:hypothetical protein DIPPA_22863 [Diplonema papillatum]
MDYRGPSPRSPNLGSSTGSLTPPSSPGSNASLDNGSLSSDPSSRLAGLRPPTKRRTKRSERSKKPKVESVESLGTRMSRFSLTVLCYTPFVWLWSTRVDALMQDLGEDLHYLPYTLLSACVVVALLKEVLMLHSLSIMYPAISFGVGIVGGCYSKESMKDQQWARLITICAHGILAGQLRAFCKRTGTKGLVTSLNPLGGCALWLCFGELACMMYRNVIIDLTSVVSSYGMLILLPFALVVSCKVIVSAWLMVFGIEKPLSSDIKYSFIRRVYNGIAWVLSTFTPLVIAASTACGTLYIMLPIVWERMIFVAPWGVLFEFGSALSSGAGSKSLFWSEAIVPTKPGKRSNAAERT